MSTLAERGAQLAAQGLRVRAACEVERVTAGRCRCGRRATLWAAVELELVGCGHDPDGCPACAVGLPGVEVFLCPRCLAKRTPRLLAALAAWTSGAGDPATARLDVRSALAPLLVDVLGLSERQAREALDGLTSLPEQAPEPAGDGVLVAVEDDRDDQEREAEMAKAKKATARKAAPRKAAKLHTFRDGDAWTGNTPPPVTGKGKRTTAAATHTRRRGTGRGATR